MTFNIYKNSYRPNFLIDFANIKKYKRSMPQDLENMTLGLDIMTSDVHLSWTFIFSKGKYWVPKLLENFSLKEESSKLPSVLECHLLIWKFETYLVHVEILLQIWAKLSLQYFSERIKAYLNGLLHYLKDISRFNKIQVPLEAKI